MAGPGRERAVPRSIELSAGKDRVDGKPRFGPDPHQLADTGTLWVGDMTPEPTNSPASPTSLTRQATVVFGRAALVVCSQRRPKGGRSR